jgi:hypothetical protein
MRNIRHRQLQRRAGKTLNCNKQRGWYNCPRARKNCHKRQFYEAARHVCSRKKRLLSFATDVNARGFIHNLDLIRLPTDQQTSGILAAHKMTALLISWFSLLRMSALYSMHMYSSLLHNGAHIVYNKQAGIVIRLCKAVVLKLFTSQPPWQEKILSAPPPRLFLFTKIEVVVCLKFYSVYLVFFYILFSSFLLKIEVLLGLQ